eukprot:1161215-Pelagomonas_calceolata.AAC.10
MELHSKHHCLSEGLRTQGTLGDEGAGGVKARCPLRLRKRLRRRGVRYVGNTAWADAALGLWGCDAWTAKSPQTAPTDGNEQGH